MPACGSEGRASCTPGPGDGTTPIARTASEPREFPAERAYGFPSRNNASTKGRFLLLKYARTVRRHVRERAAVLERD
jgi:hypothetical protein